MAVGDPTGEDLCVGTIESGTLSISHLDNSTVEITFDSTVELISGNKYAIVARTGNDESHWIKWGQYTEKTYDGGLRCYSTDAGSTWAQASTRDNYFVTKASGVTKDSNPSDPDDIVAVLQFWGDNWPAQTFTASSTYTITSIIIALWKRNAGTTGIVTFSIKGVETEFIPPAPTGKNNMLTVRRLIGVANNKVWYESI